MGYRTYLKVYLYEKLLHEDERRFYETYRKSNKDSDEEYEQLKQLARKISHVWNENFCDDMVGVPIGDFLNYKGKLYISPDSCYSQERDLFYERKSDVPDCFLILFSKEEYRNEYKYIEGIKFVDDGRGQIMHDSKAELHYCHKFFTTPDKALLRLERKSLTKELTEMKEFLQFLPEQSVIELDLTEIIDNHELLQPISMEDIFARVDYLKRTS
jgi:hypothetical protein